MSVRIDQTGQESPIAQVDHAGAGGRLACDVLDEPAANDDDGPLDVSTGFHVEEAGGFHGDGRRVRRSRSERVKQERRQRGESERRLHSR